MQADAQRQGPAFRVLLVDDQPAKLLGDLEAVDVRQLHVEENEVRVKLLRRLHCVGPVLGFADDVWRAPTP